VAALLFCRSRRVKHLVVDGRPVVSDSRLAAADEDAIAAEGHRVAQRIMSGGVPSR
jgi:hypothetical protein